MILPLIFSMSVLIWKRASVQRKSSFFVRTPTADLGLIKDALEEYGAEIHWKLGLVYLAKGDLAEAETEFKRSVEMNPTNPAEIHKHLGLIYTEQAKLNDAVGEYQEVIRLTPDDASVYEQLGDICYKQHKDTNAIQWFSQAGDIYLKKNEVQEAIRVYENILKIEPADINILNKLSDIYFNEGLIDKAIQACMRLAEIYTQDNLLDKVIILYERLLDWEPDNNEVRIKVIEIYQKILQVDPSNLQARHKLINNLIAIEDHEATIPEFISLGKTYLEKNLYEEGAMACQRVFEFDVKNVDAHLLLAEIYVKQGMTEAAKEEYLLTMNLYREMGQHDKANETYDRMTSLFPDSAEMHYELALNYLEKGEFDEGIKEFRLVLESDPKHIPTLSKLGEIYIEREKLEEGIDNYKKVIELDSGNVDVRNSLIEVYLSIGQIDGAMKELLGLGDVYTEKREFEQAINVYKRVLCYIPDSLEAREHMVKVYSLQEDNERARPEYIFLANVYDRKELYVKAIEMCKKVLELSPEDISVKKKLCTYYVKQGITDIAVKEYDGLAKLYMENGLPDSAIEMYQKIIDIKPDDFEIRMKLSDLLAGEGKLEDAVNQYFSLIEKHISEEKYDDAKGLYNEIIRLQPDNISAYRKLSELHKELEEIDKSIAVLENLAGLYESKENKGELINIYQEIGDVYLSLQNFDSAVTSFEKIINIYSEKGEDKEKITYYRKIIDTLMSQEQIDKALSFQKDLASIFFKTGDYEDSFAEYKDIVQSYLKINKIKDTIEVYRILIDNYLKQNKSDEAINDCRYIVSVYLENKFFQEAIEIYQFLVDIYNKQTQVLEASEVLKIIGDIYLNEDNKDLAIENYQKAAEGFSEHGKTTEAIDIYKKISSLAPENLENRYKLIDLYNKIDCREKVISEYCSLITAQAETGNLEKAIDIFNRSIEKINSEPTLYNCIANIYFDNQMWDEAISNYMRVLDKDSKYPGVYSKLTLTCARKGDLEGAVQWTKKLISAGKVFEIFEDFYSAEEVDLEKAENCYNWGIIYKEIGFVEDSIRAFKASSRYVSKKLPSLKKIGECFYQEGFAELASRQYRQILDIALDSTGMAEEDYLELRYSLGETFETMGKLKDAKKAYEGICEINIKYKDTMEKIMELTRRIDNQKEGDEADPKVIEFSFEN